MLGYIIVGVKLQLLVNPDNMKEFVYKDNQYNRGLVADILCCIVFFMKHS